MPDELTPEAVRTWAEGLVRGLGSRYNVPLSRGILSLFARHDQALGLLREMPDNWGMCSQWLERRNALLADAPAGRPPDKGELCQCDHCREGVPPAAAGQLTTMDHDIAAAERRLTKVEQTIAHLLEGQRLYDLTVPPLVARFNEEEDRLNNWIKLSSESEQQNKDRIVALECRLTKVEQTATPTEASSDDWNAPEALARAEAVILTGDQESTLNERVAELEAWRCDVDSREEARLDDIFEPSSQQRATQEWRPSTEKPSYDPQGIEHRVLVAEGHAVPFGDSWLLKPHRWHECAPDTIAVAAGKPKYDGQTICPNCGKRVPIGQLAIHECHASGNVTPTSDEPRCPTCDGDGEVVEDQDDEGRPILVVPCPDCSEALAAELLHIAGETFGDEPRPVSTASIRGMQDLAARCIALAEYCDRLQERLDALEERYTALEGDYAMHVAAQEQGRHRIAEIEAAFRHTHVAVRDGTDRCAQCGLDLRDAIHERLEASRG